MKNYEIIPLHSVGPVALGMSRSQVHAVLGACTRSFQKASGSVQPTDTWHNSAFQVSYSPDETVEYIELSRANDFSVACSGMAVFDTPVALLIKRLEQLAAVDTSDPEYGYSFMFPSLELSFWRPVKEDPELSFFSTIGIGRRGYYGTAA